MGNAGRDNPYNCVYASFLEMFKVGLGGALSHLKKDAPIHGKGNGLDVFKCPF